MLEKKDAQEATDPARRPFLPAFSVRSASPPTRLTRCRATMTTLRDARSRDLRQLPLSVRVASEASDFLDGQTCFAVLCIITLGAVPVLEDEGEPLFEHAVRYVARHLRRFYRHPTFVYLNADNLRAVLTSPDVVGRSVCVRAVARWARADRVRVSSAAELIAAWAGAGKGRRAAALARIICAFAR